MNKRITNNKNRTKERNENKSYVQSRMQVKQNSESCILLVSRRRTKSVKSKPNNIISRFYKKPLEIMNAKAFNIIQLVKKIINRRKQQYVRTQLAIATAATTTTVLCLRNTGSVLLAYLQQPYKRTQLVPKLVTN